MKVLILSTFEHTGGAAIAANRLLSALNHNGVSATMLCRKNISRGPKALRKQSWSSIFERLAIWIAKGFSTKDLWTTDPALFGQDITATREFMEADIIHLHWINQGFLSLDTIRKITESGKRIVWTMHDEWASGKCMALHQRRYAWRTFRQESVRQKARYPRPKEHHFRRLQ